MRSITGVVASDQLVLVSRKESVLRWGCHFGGRETALLVSQFVGISVAAGPRLQLPCWIQKGLFTFL